MANKYANEDITKKDVNRVAIRWLFSNTAAWNYERMQNVAFAFSISPVLEKIYKTKNELGQALTRHMTFFNTEYTIGSPIVGAVAAMEVQRSRGEDISDEVINSVKSGLMGPMAAIGDSLLSSTLNALLLSFGMGLGAEGNVLGPIIFIVLWAAIIIGVTMWGVQFGFSQGMRIMESEFFSPEFVEKATTALSILGLTVIGGLSAQFVSLSTGISWTSGEITTTLQSILDGLMPGLLPFILVMVTWYFLDKKNVSVMRTLLFLIVFSIVGSLLHIF